MSSNENMVFGVFILSLAALGYSVYASRKIDSLCNKMNTSVDELSETVDISLSETIVKEAVNRAADKAAYKAVQSATVEVMNEVRQNIRKEVKDAVDTAYTDLQEKVEKEINAQIGNIDISSVRRDVIKKAGEMASEKFKSDLDDILEKYNRDLTNVSNIYNSIARSISNRDDRKEMTFRIA